MTRTIRITVFALTGLLAGCIAAPTATTAPSPTPGAGQTRSDAKGIAQVWVPPGTFKMGSSGEAMDALTAQEPPDWVSKEFKSEQPEHGVTLTTGYWIDQYEVTNEAYQAFIDAGGYTTQEYWSEKGWAWLSHQKIEERIEPCGGDDPAFPRVCVTWYEAEAYAAWRGGRLPTEAEWEFAARGPESRVYPWGDTFDAELTNVVDSHKLVPVGSYPKGVSWIGAHDMAGNAMEWVQDWLDDYSADAAENPTGPEKGSVKVEKGGWWGSNEFVSRSAYRHYEDPPYYSDHHIGFRIVSR